MPIVPIGALIKSVMLDTVNYRRTLDASIIVTSHEFLTRQFVEEMHRAGLSIYIYTVDDSETITRMISFDVDGVISNFPDRIR